MVRYDGWESEDWETPDVVWKTVLASVLLDFLFAGSEILHRLKLHFSRNKSPEDVEMVERGQMMNSGGNN